MDRQIRLPPSRADADCGQGIAWGILVWWVGEFISQYHFIKLIYELKEYITLGKNDGFRDARENRMADLSFGCIGTGCMHLNDALFVIVYAAEDDYSYF